MGIIKKTVWMVVAALTLLLGLGIADPGNARLMPTFLSNDHMPATFLFRWMPSFFLQPPMPGVVPKGTADEAAMLRAIVEFNRQLSAAYLALEPAALAAEPMADSLRQDYGAEIAFLKRQGRALEQTVQDIRIEEVARLPDLTWSVNTVEAVTVRYLNAADRTPIAAYPASNYAMNYTLDKSSSGWKMIRVEARKTGKRDE